MIGNREVIVGRVFEVHKIDEGGALLAVCKKLNWDSVLEIVREYHILLEQRSALKVLELIDCLRQSIHWQGFVDSLQRGQQDILIKR